MFEYINDTGNDDDIKDRPSDKQQDMQAISLRFRLSFLSESKS
jgi:hypothetical protein